MPNKNINNFFFTLFSLIPISIIAGPAVSLTNVLLIDLLFLILLIYKKEYSFYKNNIIKYLFIFYVYLLFNSFVSIDQEIGFFRNLGFLRFIVLFVAFNYFFREQNFMKNVFISWAFILFFITIDVLFESFMGRNLVGFESPYRERIVSFFKEEPVVGGYINSFYLVIIGFLFMNFKYKKLIFIFSIIFLVAILFTGERSNSIKALAGFIILYAFNKDYDFKKKITVGISMVILLIIIIFNSNFLKLRYVSQIKSHLFQDQIYFRLYKSGFEVFKNYKIFGVGNKNYRVETCSNRNLDISEKKIYLCNTHPHQVYLELLSEHGLVGTILILFILYKIIFSKIIYVFKDKNYIQHGSLTYLILTFTPLIPSGAFFSDYMLTLFMINMSIFYSSNKKFNIFNSKKL